MGLAVIAASPLWWVSGLPGSDDSLTHTFNLWALDQQLAAGAWYPLRFPEHGLGYGYAVLSYYPPLPYALLALIRFSGLPYVLTFKLGFTLITLLAGLSSFWLGKTLFDRRTGLLVAGLYLFNPYFLANLHLRAALAEHLGLAVGPLLFGALYLAVRQPRWQSYLLASLSVALLTATHFLSTLLYLPFVLLWVLFLLFFVPPAQSSRYTLLAILLAAALTGVAMSVGYWLPAALEPGGLNQVDRPAALAEYLGELIAPAALLRPSLFVTYTNLHQMPELGAPLLLVMVSTLIGWPLLHRRVTDEQRYIWGLFMVAAVLALGAYTVYSRPLWQTLPPIALLQFPFRWLGPAALYLAVAGGGLFAGLPRWARWLALPLLLWLIVAGLRNVPTTPAMLRSIGVNAVQEAHITLAGLRAFEYDSADNLRRAGCWVWAYEYIPQRSALSDCPTLLDVLLHDAPPPVSAPAVSATITPLWMTANGLAATVRSAEPWTLSLHAFWIPGWQARLDDRPVPSVPVGALGVAGVAVPAGEHRIELIHGPTALRRGAWLVSALLLVGWWLLALRHWPRLALVTCVGPALLVGLLWGRPASHLAPVQPVMVEFAGQIALQGYTLAADEEVIQLELIWLTRQTLAASYKVFVHVIDDSGQLWSQGDARPVGYASHTNRWLPGQVIRDPHRLPIPPAMTPGRYQVRVGVYNEVDGRRLPVLNAEGAVVDDQVLLEYVELK
jgi:hypothetical protein